MKREIKKVLAMILSLVIVLSGISYAPTETKAEETINLPRDNITQCTKESVSVRL
jgi:hypothetical protein